MRNHYAIFVFAGVAAFINLLGSLCTDSLALSMRCCTLALLSLGAVGLLFLFREELPPPRYWTGRSRAGFALVCLVSGMLSVGVDCVEFHSLNLLASAGLALFSSLLIFMALNGKPTTVTA